MTKSCSDSSGLLPRDMNTTRNNKKETVWGGRTAKWSVSVYYAFEGKQDQPVTAYCNLHKVPLFSRALHVAAKAAQVNLRQT